MFRGPMIATRLAGGWLFEVRAAASGKTVVRCSNRTIFAMQGASEYEYFKVAFLV
jgi:hypothetical protein